MNPQSQLLAAFRAAVQAAMPDQAVRDAVRGIKIPQGRTVVVGGGKAGASMARAFEDAWDAPLSGVVVTRHGHALVRPERIGLLEASHPVPDANSELAGQKILGAVQGLNANDLVVVLLSGGGSALMVAPSGVTLQEKLEINQQLLRSGADIAHMNTVRKHLSRLKGGRLAVAAMPAQVVALVVSDVVGDDLSTIASGPTTPDPTTCQDALAVLEDYKIDAPGAVAHLHAGTLETPKPNHAAFSRVQNHLIVTNRQALRAAQKTLEGFGWVARIWSDSVVGQAKDAASDHATQARILPAGAALLSGGETTVTVCGTGQGGRNTEFLLALALELQGEPNVYALACDTDGIDGTGEVAGAILTPDTLERAKRLGLDARAMLANNDAHTFFAALGDAVVLGPTGTNVNDVRIVLRAQAK